MNTITAARVWPWGLIALGLSVLAWASLLMGVLAFAASFGSPGDGNHGMQAMQYWKWKTAAPRAPGGRAWCSEGVFRFAEAAREVRIRAAAGAGREPSCEVGAAVPVKSTVTCDPPCWKPRLAAPAHSQMVDTHLLPESHSLQIDGRQPKRQLRQSPK